MDPVQRAADKYVAARIELEEAIRSEAAKGRSNRSIAKSTEPGGLRWSYEQIRKIVGPRIQRL